MSDGKDIATATIERCRELGFASAGICEASPTRYRDEVQRWIAEGCHGTMEWLERRLDERLDPNVYLPNARSIICVGDRYHDGTRDEEEPTGDLQGRIARYARGRDYHKVLKRRLLRLAKALGSEHPDHEFRPCVDTAPLLEREHAQRAGLGLVGKNSLLIQPGVGSWMLLGAVVTTLPLTPTPALRGKDPCGSCTRCIDACPTNAITPFRVDASRCIAYSTIEHRSDVDDAMAEATGDWLFGCDICQEVCPHNQRSKRRVALSINDAYRPRHADLGLVDILDWSAEDRDETLRGSAARRATLEMWRRNALICIANAWRSDRSSMTPSLIERIRRIRDDSTEASMVRDAARRAITVSLESGVEVT